MIRAVVSSALAVGLAGCLGASSPTPAPIEQKRGAAAVEGAGAPIERRTASPSRAVETAAAPEVTPREAAAGVGERDEAASVGPLDDWGRPIDIVVESGDTLFSLSEAFQVALRPLIDLNGLEAPFQLQAGQTLKLPPPNYYVVRPGDTLYGVARRHRVHFRSLALMNGIKEPFVVSPGDVVVLPAMARDWEARLGGDADTQQALTISMSTGAGATPTSSGLPSAAAGSGTLGPHRFIWPLDGRVLSGFGVSAPGRRNDGVNIAAEPGAPVVAAADGVVVYAGEELEGYGRLILVQHDGGWISAYAHNAALEVRVDQKVTQGERIARAGSTGSVDAPQLHFELRRSGKPVDPLSLLPPRAG